MTDPVINTFFVDMKTGARFRTKVAPTIYMRHDHIYFVDANGDNRYFKYAGTNLSSDPKPVDGVAFLKEDEVKE
jgi:hypothetical protein